VHRRELTEAWHWTWFMLTHLDNRQSWLRIVACDGSMRDLQWIKMIEAALDARDGIELAIVNMRREGWGVVTVGYEYLNDV
jgi:hypothetical protein